MATFSAKNFPADVPGNSSFSGIGERTIYAPVTSDLKNYNYKDGFRVAKSTDLISKDGHIIDTLKANQKVYFTHPAKLYKDPGKKRGIYAEVSLKSPGSKSNGLAAIGHITKPPGKGQSRIGAGAQTQYAVAEQIEKLASEKNKKYEFISTARPGSTAPDLIVRYDNKKVQFEIKGTSSPAAPITFFDKSVNRRTKVPEIIDSIAEVFKPSSVVVEYGQSVFLATMAYYNAQDSAIGLAGDPGVISSGKLPPEFVTTDTSKLRKLRDVIIEHFKEGGDDYFVVHNRSQNEFKIYSVNRQFNPLGYEPLPLFKSFALATYGGASSGSTRVGLKIKI